MAQFIYIDETGSPKGSFVKCPTLALVAVVVDEGKVQPLAEALNAVARTHLGRVPEDFEFHGVEIWEPRKWWVGLGPPALLAAYEDAISLLARFDIQVSHARINRVQLHERHQGAADSSAYLLALQFLLEKLDKLNAKNKIVIADESKEQQLGALRMVADLQQWGYGEVPGARLATIIDSLHFVSSHASPGVQLADLVAYILQRAWRGQESHPEVESAMTRMYAAIDQQTPTWRDPWPQAK